MADKPALRPDAAVGEALKAVARDTLSEARRALADELKPDAIAVHDYRKAMKRWRSLLRLLQPFLGEDGRRLRIEARDFARELSGARDAQAAIEALDDLVEAEAELSPRSVASMRARLDEIRLGAEAATLTEAVRARLIIGLENAAASIDSWPLQPITFAELARELTRTYARLRADAPEDWRAAEPEVLHEMRSRVVVHRYQMELIVPLWPKLGRVWVAETQRLRDRLGAFQDLSVLQGFTVPHAALAPWRSRLTPLILARRATQAKAAQRIARRLLAEKPKAFRRRIEALWEQGRR
ncbi:MAG: CHAD domain-containing protein [Alphaproteobacteria bacterium]|nr:MAG: CHAD domain-containing protein [Alphaproteobacteria bacterium]